MLVLTVENMLPIFALDFQIWNYVIIAETCPPSWYLVENGVAHCRSRVCVCCLMVTPFRPWNDIGIFNYRIVICTFGFRLPSWILDTRWYTSIIVLQSAVNKTTLEVLHTALMVTKMQRSLCCVKSSAAYDQSLSLGLRDGATDAAYVTQRCRTAGHDPRHVGLLGRVAVDVYLEVGDVLSGLM